MSIINWPLEKWLDNVALGALSSKETLKASFDLARNVIDRGIPGDFVECGVFGGSQCAVMARAIMEHYRRNQWDRLKDFPPKVVHLFDTFAGVPEPGPEDIEWIVSGHKIGQSICTLEAVQAHMKEWGIPDELLRYHVGLFSDTVRRLEYPKLSQIAVLRLDGDLYESTKVCLEYLYPLVSPGGWIIVDDFNLSGARKAFLDYIGGASGPGYFQKQP
jgi:hypothetical protein